MMAFLFEFVREFSSELANLAERIEEKLFSEPHASMMQARLYAEKLVKLISKEEELESVYSVNHAERIYRLYRKDIIDEDLYKKLEYIRKKGNKAAHEETQIEIGDMLQIHQFLFEISVWYMQVYVSYCFEAPEYKVPTPTASESKTLNHIDEVIKPYLDKKLDDMWADIQRKLDEIKIEKEKITSLNQSGKTREVPPAKTIEVSEEMEKIFADHHFTLTNKSKKAAEFENSTNKVVVYLLPNRRLTIVLHPETAKSQFGVDGKPYHNTALRRFPKEMNNGKIPTNCGYPFTFEGAEELNDFLKNWLGN